jgi:methionine salvage enolase-phosphatase E1
MKKNKYLYRIILCLALSCSLLSGKNFIFDFGGVLINTNKCASFQHIGLTNIAECTIRLRINPFKLDNYIKTAFFTTLNAIDHEHNLSTTHSYHPTYDEKGNALPFLMCAWLQGSMTCSEIRLLINDTIAMHPEWFKCRAEQRIVENILHMIFTPHYFVNSRTISTEGIAFIKKCKAKGHKIYGLSNWDAESFALLKIKYPELFDLFDGIIISGEVNINKPHETIYQTLLERFQLRPDQCWFIDDQEENIIAAQKLGINAVIHKSSFKQLVHNINVAYSKSVIRRENFKNNGNIEIGTNTINNAIIDGENISLADSTI